MKRYAVIAVSLLMVATGAQSQTTPVQVVSQTGPSKAASRHDAKLPVEISSDTLEVLQKENRAIFKGNVIAVQGEMRLKSDTMIVHYKQKSDDAKAVAKPAAPAAPKAAGAADATQSAMGAITRIDVEGNVFMATPEESAKGDRGNYDVESKTIHLFGDNVILTREKNILRGTALEYNLETGRSLLTHEGDSSGNAGQRVRGVFVPNQTPQNQKNTPPAVNSNNK